MVSFEIKFSHSIYLPIILFFHWFILPFNENGWIAAVGEQNHHWKIEKPQWSPDFKLFPSTYYLIFKEKTTNFYPFPPEVFNYFQL